MQVSAEFWPVTGTTMPILALAIVVEARAMVVQWDVDMPTGLKAVSWLASAYTLFISGVTETVSFSILSGQSRSTPGWVSVARHAVYADVGVLLLGPIIVLGIQTFARPVARVVVRYNPRLLKLNRVRRQSLRRLRRVEKPTLALLGRVEALDRKRLATGHPECEVCIEVKRGIEAERERLTAILAEVTSLRSAMSEDAAFLDQKVNEAVEDIARLLARDPVQELAAHEPITKRDDGSSAVQ